MVIFCWNTKDKSWCCASRHSKLSLSVQNRTLLAETTRPSHNFTSLLRYNISKTIMDRAEPSQVKDENKQLEQQPQQDQPKKTVTKEKIRSIMEAASALTALCDEESESTAPETLKLLKEEKQSAASQDDKGKSNSKRFIPEHKKPDSALTFPEKVRPLGLNLLDSKAVGFRRYR